jgi:hypothetical protein
MHIYLYYLCKHMHVYLYINMHLQKYICTKLSGAQGNIVLPFSTLQYKISVGIQSRAFCQRNRSTNCMVLCTLS